MYPKFTFYNPHLEEILDEIENEIGEDNTNQIINSLKNKEIKFLSEPTHPLTNTVNTLIAEAGNIQFDKDQDRYDYEEALLFANQEIIEKNDGKICDSMIDSVEDNFNLEASDHFDSLMRKNHINPQKARTFNVVNEGVQITISSEEAFKTFRPFMTKRINITDDVKKKVLNIHRLMEKNGLNEFNEHGESATKAYGFGTYFKTVGDLKDLVLEQAKEQDVNRKKELVKEIVDKKKELEGVIKKYDEVIGYIKDNFDADKVILPGNVYPGRVKKFDGNLDNFSPNLPPRWDFKNAPYSSILNGYAQYQGIAKYTNTTFEKLLEDPTKYYLKGTMRIAKLEDNNYVFSRNSGKTLGQRMANILTQKFNSYNEVKGMTMLSRGLSFVNGMDIDNPNIYDNQNIINMTAAFTDLYSRNAGKMFGYSNGRDRVDFQPVKNLFAFGDKVDDLYTISPNYYDDKLRKGNLYKDYVKEIRNNDNKRRPVREALRLMDVMKDYMIEKDNLITESLKGDGVSKTEIHNLGYMFCAMKDYFKDFIHDNNINLLNIKYEEGRKKMLSFMEDPFRFFAAKYQKELFENNPELYETIYGQMLAANYLDKKDSTADYLRRIAEFNNKERGYNVGKNITRILEDNKGGLWERFVGSTSNEYKALARAAKVFMDKNSPSFGDVRSVYESAKTYLRYKLPEGADENSLSTTSKKRVEFCRSIIKAYEDSNKVEIKEKDFNNDIIKEEKLIDPGFINKLEEDVNNNDIAIIEVDEEFENEIDRSFSVDSNDNSEDSEDIIDTMS